MFNFFDIGGFLDWQLYPQALTFIDGRTYNQEVFMEHQVVTGAMPGWEKVLEKYGSTISFSNPWTPPDDPAGHPGPRQ